MNDENLIPLTTRQQRERKKIASKGGKASVKSKKEKKEQEKQRKSLTEILKNVVTSEIKSKSIKKQIKDLGIEGNDYFTALCAFATVKAMKKGDFNAISKIIELTRSSEDISNSEEDKSFNNLIEAIKNVRKTKPKTK